MILTILIFSTGFCLGIIGGGLLVSNRLSRYAEALRAVLALTEPSRLRTRNHELIIDEGTCVRVRQVAQDALQEDDEPAWDR